MRILISAMSVATLALASASCGGGDFGGASGDFGATQGGVQDMSLARDLIAAGKVPPPEAFIVEGMFSEHELGLEGAPCETLLCLRSAVGFAPGGDGADSGWFQVGLSSTIDPEAFVRPSLTLIATVDVSGSMGWSYGGNDTPAAVAVELLSQVAATLGPADRIAIVTYGSDVRTALELTSGADTETIQAAIDRLGEGGSTNMEAGMRRAYELARAAGQQTEQTRVMLFTDARPNVGATGASDFEQLAAAGAADDIGLSVMGLGLGLGVDVFKAMSQLRGGNAFSLMTTDDVAPHMDDNWPWMVSPIAYDLRLSVETPLAIADAHGFPGTEGDEIDATLDVATVFLSKRKGALLVRLDGETAAEGFTVDAGLSYTELDGTERGQALSSTFDPAALDERGQYFEQAAVAKTTALALLVSGMAEAAELYGADRDAAVERMTAVADRFAADAEILGDSALDPEVELAAALLELMVSGAEQGDFYGQY